MDLTPELRKCAEEIAKIAKDFGLDFYDTVFELVEPDELNQIAAYGGFPKRYPHWRFGMEYEQLSKSYTYGLAKIYELVINNDPCYAYLMTSNALVDQKLVMAHVFAHCDFFKNNIWFSRTNRKMMDEMANHGTRIRRYVDRYGLDEVEAFVDVCLSLDNLIDYHAPFIKRGTGEDSESPDMPTVHRFQTKDYMDKFVNPEEYLEQQRKKILEEFQAKQSRFPQEPLRDVLEFFIQYAPLEPWKRDVLSIIREEAYYFAPQGQTKIMNEGWASYWHSRIMTEKVLNDSEIIDFADHHSGTVAMSPDRLNPYKVGIELFRDIEVRWNKGRFGMEYERCNVMKEKETWDKNLGLGRDKIFEVRRVHNDITFIDTFLTAEFCRDHGLFTFRYNYKTGKYEIEDRDFLAIKQKLLFSLTNFGQPFISVTDANFENTGSLLLQHRYEGIELKLDWAKVTLENLFQVWSRPVHLGTVFDGRDRLLSFDGKKHSEKDLGQEKTK